MLETTSAEHAAALAPDRLTFNEQRLREENALMSRSQRLSEQESQLEADQAALEELRADLTERAQAFERATAPMRSARKPA
jgi:hypothetical protein